ncbi:Zinc finger RING-type domain containing protein [Klebsormidium nitens]|uniref:Zinc finger RING-type domain containing protein n=1 Tax=Klebsormidium nitens TaxID=105231 RepID=A0A1Y1HNC7_KLENI|nr:Zinc finger RING-type domain containing protein [Klebsormidium nitens]|eukprot:GAQ78057.1 Zinc finger RING-type domain containing protein [Klebsormidium nitens]
MGFSTEVLLSPSSLPAEFFCPICHDVISPLDAVQTPCGHMACGPCLSQSLRMVGPECPSDRTPLTEAELKSVREHNPLVYRIMGRAQVKCENAEGGCEWRGELSELAIHLAGCPQAMVRCKDCGAKVPREQMDVHHFQCNRQCEDCLEKDIELAEYRQELVRVRAALRNAKGEIEDLRAQLNRINRAGSPSPTIPSPSGRGFVQSEQRSYPTIQTEAVARQRSVSNGMTLVSGMTSAKGHVRRSSAPDGRTAGGGVGSRARVYPLQHLPPMSRNELRAGLGLEPIDSNDDNDFDR